MATVTERRDRRRAKAALAHAKSAEKEAKRLADTLPPGRAKRRLEALVAESRVTRRAAKADRTRAPRRAARTAARATAGLDAWSRRVLPTTASRGAAAEPGTAIADAAAAAKRRAALLKQRRKQADRVRKWAKSAAAHTVVQAVTTPEEPAPAKRRR
ncbi:hypothetical protein ROT00_05040 [Agromyces mediolanus]|uniref:hypothetical protein n=1 Tax=Agromyces mediolanus TaxID=41986 RepID=UPI0038350BFF